MAAWGRCCSKRPGRQSSWPEEGPAGGAVRARPWVDCREEVRSEAREAARVLLPGPARSLVLLVLLRRRLATSSIMICASSPAARHSLLKPPTLEKHNAQAYACSLACQAWEIQDMQNTLLSFVAHMKLGHIFLY